MPVTVQIDGVGKVQLDDSFKGLSAADQQATVDEIANSHAPHVAAPTSAQPSDIGGLGSFIRGAANGATFNLADTIAAAGDATIPLDSGSSIAPTWMQRFQENRANQKAQTGLDNTAHPGATIAGNVVGGVINPVTRALPVAKTLTGAIGQGVGIGAGYGAGAGISNQEDAQGFAKNIAQGAVLGGAIPAALPAIGAAVRGAGKVGTAVLGNLTTGAGANAVRGAYDAGVSGGDAGQAFLSNMRGDVPWSDVVQQAKGALSNMRAARGAAYRSGMADISKDNTVLSFEPLDQAMNKASGVKTFKGKDLSPSTADVRGQITKTIDEWKALPPEEYHTPEGFDALKQQIGDIRDSQPYGSPQRNVADTAYNAVRSTITDQAPGYSKVMEDYTKASQVLSDLQRELSLGPKGNPNTALRKLQSVMRDNVNTSFGDRAKYAKTLDDAGATTLLPALAGQSMSALLPRGLSKIGAGADVALAAFHNPAAIAALPLMSPRLVGEAAYGLGRGVSALPRLSARSVGRPAVLGGGVAGLLPELPRLTN